MNRSVAVEVIKLKTEFLPERHLPTSRPSKIDLGEVYLELHSGKEMIDVEIRREGIKLKNYLLPGRSLGDSIDSSWRRNL